MQPCAGSWAIPVLALGWLSVGSVRCRLAYFAVGTVLVPGTAGWYCADPVLGTGLSLDYHWTILRLSTGLSTGFTGIGSLSAYHFYW